MALRFEYKKDNSNKFWEIDHDEINKKVTVKYGKIGGVAKETIHTYDRPLFWGLKFVSKMIKSKTDKGYKLVRKKKENEKKVETKKAVTNKIKQCPPGKIINPKTDRCIILSTEIKKEPKDKKRSTLKTKKKLKIMNPPGKVLWDVKKQGVMLAHTFKDAKTGKIKTAPKGYPKAPKGWWLSEKFDGYRAIWDGTKFVSRAGNIFNVPEWFKKWLPTDAALDGELFMGRECFEKCGIFRKKIPDDKEWREADVKYNIFDSPSLEGDFETRQEKIKIIIKTQCELKAGEGKCPLEYTKQTKVETEEEVYKMFNSIVEKGGEGVMLRAPNSPYEAKRTNFLLKVKPSFDDECKIIGYKGGSGKYKGMLGAFKCQMIKNPDIKFQISGMDDGIRKDYEKTHPIGAIVTFGYFGLSEKGVPRHPNYIRIRDTEN